MFFLILSSCQKDRQAVLSPQQNIRLSIDADPTVLDSRRARDLNSLTVIRMLFEGLTRAGETGKAELALADRAEAAENGLVYTFHLRPCKWSNGDAVTALDFARTWKTILSPAFASDIAYQLYPIKNARKAKLGEVELDAVGVRVLDDRTFVVELEQPTPYFLELVSTPSFFPVPLQMPEQRSDSNYNSSQYVVNGPFQMQEWKYSDHISLIKNPSYWASNTVKLDSVELFVASSDTAWRMYEEGHLDWAGSPLSTLPCDAIPSLQKNGSLQSSPFFATYFYRLNTAPLIHGEKNPLADSALRRALSFAIDRNAITSHVLQGGQTPARGLIPPGMDPQHSDASGFGRQLAVQEACPFEALQAPLVLSYLNTERNAAIAQVVQHQWKARLGIQTVLEAIEPKVFFQRISRGEFQIAAGSWTADFNDPINFLDIFKYKNASVNNTGWESPVYIDLLNRSDLCQGEARMNLLREAEKVLLQEMPMIPIFHFSLNYLKRPSLYDVVLSPMGQLDVREAYFHAEKNVQRKN